MFVNSKNLGRSVGIGALALALWLVWWCQAERQVRRAQRRLLNAVESKDWVALDALLANDYRDGWEHDKAFVLKNTPLIGKYFPALNLDGEIRSVENAGDGWWLRQKIMVSGIGTDLLRGEVNDLKQPFSMKWRKAGWQPWAWELTRVEQPELRIPDRLDF